MSTGDNTVTRKLKFKITTKGIRDASEDKSHQDTMKAVLKKGDRAAAGGKKCPEIIVSGKQTSLVNCCKRKPEISLDVQKGKRQKMDQGLKHKCGSILKELMNHPDGWIFSEPVDPVKLQIPDYFSIIKEPMDLGTIKHKLEGNMYFCAEEFASDVRLTFSNAVLYNPPGNRVHHSANTLDGNFSRRWKLLESKLENMNKDDEQVSFGHNVEKFGQGRRKNVEKNDQDTKPTGLDKASLRIKLSACRPMSTEEKRTFRTELVQLLDRKMMGNLQSVFQKLGLCDLNEEALDSFINSTADENLWKLRRDIKAFSDAKGGKARPEILAQNGRPSLKKPIQKGRCDKGAGESTGHRIGSTENKCSSCLSLTCHCQRKNGSSQICTSEISSERSSEHDHYGDSKLDSEVKHPVASHASSFGVDSDGLGVVLNEENSPHLSTPAPAATSLDGWNSFNVQLSPKKALRAAMLKSRFADTIFRATHQAILDNKSDHFKIQQEKAKLEREQMEEKARIEAEIKAAKEASQREQDDMKMRREKERSAARKALEMMKKSDEMYENMDITKELEKLFCGYPSYSPNGGVKGTRPPHPLERLGLYIRDDYLEEDIDDSVLFREDGEIL